MFFDSSGGMDGGDDPAHGSNVIDASGSVNEIQENTVVEVMCMTSTCKDFGNEGTKLPAWVFGSKKVEGFTSNFGVVDRADALGCRPWRATWARQKPTPYGLYRLRVQGRPSREAARSVSAATLFMAGVDSSALSMLSAIVKRSFK